MRAEIETIQQMMEKADYVTDPAIATSVHLAMTLRKPLLIEGHAGVGKTEIAKVMARMLDTQLIRLQCYEGLDAAAALYEWNYQKQLLHIKLAEGAHRGVEEQEQEIFSEAFLLRRPLLEAISKQDRPPVLFSGEVFAELAALAGDAGARAVVQARPDRVARVQIDAPMPADVDTPEDYARLHVQ